MELPNTGNSLLVSFLPGNRPGSALKAAIASLGLKHLADSPVDIAGTAGLPLIGGGIPELGIYSIRGIHLLESRVPGQISVKIGEPGCAVPFFGHKINLLFVFSCWFYIQIVGCNDDMPEAA